jgi:hypothetical protein
MTCLSHQTLSHQYHLPPHITDNMETVIYFFQIYWQFTETVYAISLSIDKLIKRGNDIGPGNYSVCILQHEDR